MLFKDQLVQLREAAGLTQSQLADVSGVPLWTLRKYEQGQRGRVTLGVAARLARSLGKTCEVFADCEDVAGDEADEAGDPPAVTPPRKKGRPKKADAGEA